MSQNSPIEWTDATWNPVRGCSRVSAGCMNCYAERVALRFSGPGMPYEGLVQKTSQGAKWTGKVRLVPEALDQPLRWRKPRRIFVNSMSDLFHEDVPDDFILQVFDIMRECQNGYTSRIGGERGQLVASHTFQILTKRPERMRDFCTRLRFAQNDSRGLYLAGSLPHNGFNPLPSMTNVWLGVSVEDQATADERIPLLMQMPAAKRFISAEPLLGPVDLENWTVIPHHYGDRYLDWVIAGGESGPRARPSHPEWFAQLRNECQRSGIPFFFKQWGHWAPASHFRQDDISDIDWDYLRLDGSTHNVSRFDSTPYSASDVEIVPVGKKRAGRLLDGREWNEAPA